MRVAQVVFRISIIILIVEILIMLALSVLPFEIPAAVEVFLDASILVLLSTPIIYQWVIKPFIHMRDQAIQEVRYLASNDALTGLPNRDNFLTVLNHMLLLVSNDASKIAVIIVDLNRFKVINETFGNSIANSVIKHVAGKLNESLGFERLLARVGPDQFAILIENKESDDEIFHLAKEILATIEAPIEHEEHFFSMEACIGISEFPKDASNGEELLKFANNAMRQAKSNEKDNIAFYTTDLTEKVHEHFVLEESMRLALVNSEFYLVYQPKVDAWSNEMIGVEALIRWKHPSRGIVSPAEFIPLAEETGIIIPLGQWVLQEAIAQQKIWLNEGKKPIVMSINLSGRQLNSEQIEYIIRTLEASGIDMQYFDIEITETYLMKDAQESQRLLERLSRSGVSISLDDFGSGYSSLGYLKRFKIDTLKIDQMLIRDIEVNANDFTIAKAIVGIGHVLDLKVVAEGVETEKQMQMLKEIGCDCFQGYYFSKPVEADEVFHGERYSC